VWFGSSVLWLKLLSAAFLAGGLGFWTLAMGRVGGRPLQLLFVLWAIFPPPFAESIFHTQYANHTESLLFLGVSLYLFTRMSDAAPRFGEAVLFGLAAGFAVLFSASNLPFVAAAAVTAVARWRRRGVVRLLWRRFLVF